MGLELTGWQKNWQLMSAFFGEKERAIIKERISRMKTQHVVYCSFENRFAKSGGLAAVTMRILPYIKAQPSIQRVVLITPFYPHIIDEKKLAPLGKTLQIKFGEKLVKVDILTYKPANQAQDNSDGIEEYFIKAEGFFEAHNRLNDPYIYHKDDTFKNNDAIKENALLYSKVVPYVANLIDLKEDVIFHLQEWQTAMVALTSKIAIIDGLLNSCATVQTMHNPFDSYIPPSDFSKIVDSGRFQRYLRFGAGHTAYQVGLQMIDGPITTVSKHFAYEFTEDIFQTEHFAPHLQDIFRVNGVYGINNGMFKEFPEEFTFENLKTIDPEVVEETKLKQRSALLEVLNRYTPEGRFGFLNYKGGSITRLPEEIPILVMSGRLDPMQKGFDIFLQAIELFQPDEIKVVLTPMPIKDSDLDYFYKVAYRCRGNLTVFPIKMTEGYHELQTGSTFGIMPSIYEPFGAAVEFMTNGTITIARETGGLKDQVGCEKCGFMFREDKHVYRMEHIRSFCASAHRVQDRKANPWVQSMVQNLYQTIKKAAQIYRDDSTAYYAMVTRGLQKAATFDWKDSVNQYMEVYHKAVEINGI